MERTKSNKKDKKHICIFEPSENDIVEDIEKYYDDSALIPIGDDSSFIKGQICNVEIAMKLKQLERLFENHHRYYYALQKIEQAIRYLHGYLGDYTISVKRELKPNLIRVIIEVEPYDELNSIERIKEKFKREFKRIFPDLDEDKVNEIAERLAKGVVYE